MTSRKYTLYLDESISHNDYKNEVFCMAGVIINDNDYKNIITPEIHKLKSSIWHDESNPTKIVMHQKDVNEGQRNKTTNPDFERFNINKYSRMLYDGLGEMFNKDIMTVVGACIIQDDLNDYFSNRIKVDKYLITLQLLLENYSHFLCANNGTGSILYESRNQIEDEKMRSRFYSIKLMGSMYINSKTMKKRLLTIDFPNKMDNNIGLQIADFTPNYFARNQLNKKNRKFNINKQLRKARYDGNLNLRDRFGVKIMP